MGGSLNRRHPAGKRRIILPTAGARLHSSGCYRSLSPSTGATLGARLRNLTKSLGFAVPARSLRNSLAVRSVPTFSATAAAMN
jgi:hypothetical protein